MVQCLVCLLCVREVTGSKYKSETATFTENTYRPLDNIRGLMSAPLLATRCPVTEYLPRYEGRSESKERFAIQRYEGWNFNFGNTPLYWIQELLE